MKNTIIKKEYLLLFILFVSPYVLAKTYKSLDDVINQNSTNPAPAHSVNFVDNSDKEAKPVTKDKRGFYSLTWKSFHDYDHKARKPGKVLSKYVDKKVSLKGFMIPLDYAGKSVKSFLLVPYMPSCSHVPPPSENMIINVHVKKEDNLKPSYAPVEIRGKLILDKVSKNADPYMPTGVFSMKATEVKVAKN